MFRTKVTIRAVPPRRKRGGSARVRETWYNLINKHMRKPKEPLKSARVFITFGTYYLPGMRATSDILTYLLEALARARIIETDRYDIVGPVTYRWKQTEHGKGFVQICVVGRDGKVVDVKKGVGRKHYI